MGGGEAMIGNQIFGDMKNSKITKSKTFFFLAIIIVCCSYSNLSAQSEVLHRQNGGVSWSLEFNKPLSVAFASFNKTLDETDYTVVIMHSGATVNLPDPTNVAGRAYVLINNTGSSKPIGLASGTSYFPFGTTVPSSNCSVPSGSSITIQSNGTSAWYRIH